MINIPNFITLLRLILIPIIIIYLLQGRYELALVLFIIAGLSDALDGFLARALKQKTLLGAILDPIADKLLLDSIYILSAYLELMPDWVAVIVVSRDIFILIGFIILTFFKKRLEVKPSIPSKMTTASQIITVICVLGGLPQEIVAVVIYLTAGLTIFSGLHYLYQGLKSLSEEELEAE